jgi:uncharacterized membrane protein YcaP (DUF421 family)
MIMPPIHLPDFHHLSGVLAAAADVARNADVIWKKMWHEILVPDVPWIEKVLRPVFVYFFLIIGLRIAGKRELAQLNPFDLIVLLTLSNTVQNAIIGNDNSVSGGFVGAATLLAINYLLVRVVRRNKWLQRLLEGRSDVLVWRGKLMDQNLEKEMMTRSDLTAAAHKQGIASLKDVERCVLEPTGTITFIEKKPGHDVERHEELMALISLVRKELVMLRSVQPAASAEGNGNGAENGADE